MTEYHIPNSEPSSIILVARAAKAKRQAVLARVRAQRALAHKKTVAELFQAGTLFRGSDLEKRYQRT